MSDTRATITPADPSAGPRPDGSPEVPEGSGIDPGPASPETTEEPSGDLLAGKFKTQDDLVKAYEEAQRKITELSSAAPADPTAPAEPAKTPGTIQVDPEKHQGAELKKLFEQAGQDFLNSGEVSAETRKALEAAGIANSMIDTHLDGLEAAVNAHNVSVLEATGLTKEEYESMQDWAARTLTASELNAYNASVGKMDNPDVSKLAALGLVTRYKAATGAGRRVEEGGLSATGVQPFSNDAEYMEAVSDPRYQQSEKYRQEVHQRLAASPNLL